MLTFVLGGTSSGKSKFAEKLCFKTKKPRIYIATAQAFDDEMKLKIRKHLAQRGEDWATIEAPTEIEAALDRCTTDDVVLLDCATLWLSNIMLAERDVRAHSTALIAALTSCPAQIVVVSNEVGQGIVPDTKLGRQFRDAQGELNQMLAARADLVVQVIAGLPQVLKGTLP